MKKNISVVVGLIFNEREEILLAWRDARKTPGNCWEFPGGKIEPGENGYQALCRELTEEIGITVLKAAILPSIIHQYDTYQVILHPWRIESFRGIPQGMEGQMILWSSLNQLSSVALPAANYAIVDLLLAQKSL
jgi:8-oxo-dGTP diphosphatase